MLAARQLLCQSSDTGDAYLKRIRYPLVFHPSAIAARAGRRYTARACHRGRSDRRERRVRSRSAWH